MTAAEPPARRWRAGVWVAAVVVLAAANVAWNVTADVAPVSFPLQDAETPLRITSVDWRLADEETLHVVVTVRNLDARRRRGLVWWQLAPDRASSKGQAPWPRRAYESRYLDVEISAGAEETFRWIEVPMVPAGTYEVHAWARYAMGGSFRPSDGRRATDGAVALARAPALLRHRPTPTDAAVTRVDTTTVAGSLQALVVVSNLTDRPRHGWLAWTLSAPDGDPRYWWRWAGATAEPRYREVELGPGAETVVDLLARGSPPPGTYALRVTLELDDVGPSTTVEPAGDDVLSLVDVAATSGADAIGRRP